MRWLSLLLIVLAGCKFDPAGVAVGNGDDDGGDDGGDDTVAIDAPRSDGGAPDAIVPDATPPDAMDLDLDDDTVPDAIDNCVSTPNLDQHDEDADAVGDACDNCPHVANATQANTTEPDVVMTDEVGDACDPNPTTADVIALFDPFSGTGAPTGWTAIGGTWTQSGDHVSQSTTAGANYLYRNGLSATNMVVETSIDVDVVTPGGGQGTAFRSVGTMSRFTAGAQSGTGYMCLVLDDANDVFQAVMFVAPHTDAGGTNGSDTSSQIGSGLAAGQNHVIRSVDVATAHSCTLVRASPVAVQITDGAYASGTVALRTNTASASFRYVVVFTAAP
jgi:hypothetical protein